MIDVLLEMRMAELMAQQEASGFRFDVTAAERVRGELQKKLMTAQSRQSPHDLYTYPARYIHLSVPTRLRVM